MTPPFFPGQVRRCGFDFGHLKRLMLLFAFVAAQVLPIVAQAQPPRLNTGWPALDYQGKPAQTDGSYSRTIVRGSQRETTHYSAESRTTTATDGKMQIRRGAAAEESRTFRLGGIESGAKHQTEFYDGPKKTVEGSELGNWTVKLAPRALQLVFYRKQ